MRIKFTHVTHISNYKTYFLEIVDGMDGQLIEELMTSEGKLKSMQNNNDSTQSANATGCF